MATEVDGELGQIESTWNPQPFFEVWGRFPTAQFYTVLVAIFLGISSLVAGRRDAADCGVANVLAWSVTPPSFPVGPQGS